MPTTLCDNCCQALQRPLLCARCKTAQCKTSTCSKDCQIKAWKETEALTRWDPHGSKADGYQMRVLKIIKQLDDSAGWRCVAAQERAFRAVAAAVLTSMPGKCCVCLLHPRQRE